MCKKSSDAAAVAASMTAMPCHIIGDALHIVLLAGIAIYGIAISQLIKKSDDSVKKWPSFDSDWLQHGFCMPHDEVPFLSTHERSGCKFVMIRLFNIIFIDAHLKACKLFLYFFHFVFYSIQSF